MLWVLQSLDSVLGPLVMRMRATLSTFWWNLSPISPGWKVIQVRNQRDSVRKMFWRRYVLPKRRVTFKGLQGVISTGILVNSDLGKWRSGTGLCSYNSPRYKTSGLMETKQLGGWKDAQEIVCYPKLSGLAELNMEPKRSQDISKNE